MKPVNLYFHIPFCKRRCAYCAFYTVKWDETVENDYIGALIKEVKQWKKRLENYRVQTIYFGGGTPSLIKPTNIERVIQACFASFSMLNHPEITMESNPDSLSLERLNGYKSAGVNRLSIGLQAWQDSILEYFGRLHDRETFELAFGNARKAGFKNISVDLIFGIPGQTMENWIESVNRVVLLQPEHISCYSLELNNNSRLGVQYLRGTLVAMDDDSDREMYHWAVSYLREAGYEHYELSNFSKKGFACRHNVDFWQQKPFVGMGGGASSYFDETQFHHIENVQTYMNNPGAVMVDKKLSEEETRYDFVLLAMRMTRGMSFADYFKEFRRSFEADFGAAYSELKELGLVVDSFKRLKLTPKGMDLYDSVMKILAG